MPMQKERHVAVWLRMLAEKEIRTARNSKKLLNSQGKATKAAYLEGGQLKVEQAIKQGMNDWGRVLVATYSTTIRDFAEYTQEQLGMKSKANFIDMVSAFISKNALLKSNLITNTTLDLARNAIAKGVEAGASEIQIANSLNAAIGGGLSVSRSRTIARTEVHDAATFGMQEQAEQSQLLMIREWVSVHDDRTRDIENGSEFGHAQMDGVQRGMDEPFDVPMADGGVEQVDRPGEGSAGNSINCRCTLIYIPQETNFEGQL